jgi:hypothetical protein
MMWLSVFQRAQCEAKNDSPIGPSEIIFGGGGYSNGLLSTVSVNQVDAQNIVVMYFLRPASVEHTEHKNLLTKYTSQFDWLDKNT